MDVPIANLVQSSNREYSDFTPLSTLSNSMSMEMMGAAQKMPSVSQDMDKFMQSVLKQVEVSTS